MVLPLSEISQFHLISDRILVIAGAVCAKKCWLILKINGANRNIAFQKLMFLSTYVLIKKNLQTAIRNLSYTYLFTSRYANKSVRHAAYCQYVMGNHGHVGARHQVVIPLCWVCAIRGKKHQFQLKYLKSTTSPGLKRYF